MSSWQNGGGDRYLEEIPGNARKFAARVKKNVEDWNFDGVDFFNLVNEAPCEKICSFGPCPKFWPKLPFNPNQRNC